MSCSRWCSVASVSACRRTVHGARPRYRVAMAGEVPHRPRLQGHGVSCPRPAQHGARAVLEDVRVPARREQTTGWLHAAGRDR